MRYRTVGTRWLEQQLRQFYARKESLHEMKCTSA
jgi:hypothetical protein